MDIKPILVAYKTYIIVLVIGVAVGAVGAWKFLPANTIVKKETVTVTEFKTDQKVIDKAIEDWKGTHQSYWKEKVIVKVPCPPCVSNPQPDGKPAPPCPPSQIIEIDREGGSSDTNAGHSDSTHQADTHTEGKTETKTTTVTYRPEWMLTGMVGIGHLSPTGPLTYGLGVQYRLVGPMWIGVWGNGGAVWQGGASVSVEW